MERVIYSVGEGVGSDQTKKKYEYQFKCFLEHFDIKDPRLLLEKNDPRYVESYIITYIKHLLTHQAPATVHHTIAAIIHFFDMNDMLLNKKKLYKFIPPDESSNEDRPYTTEEIQQILSRCDERTRVIFLLMASTGMRIGAIHCLRFGDIRKIEEYNLYRISVYATSRKDRYYTFCTPECAAAIDSYLDYRRTFGENITNDAPLIREQFNTRDRLKMRFSKPKFMNRRGLETLVVRTIQRAGLNSNDDGDINVMRTHGIRKRVITLMKKAKVDYSDREYLVGHKYSRGLDVNYDRTSEEDRLTEYLKAIDLLTIYSENRLRKKIHQLESQHSDEWNQLKAQMNELREFLNQKA